MRDAKNLTPAESSASTDPNVRECQTMSGLAQSSQLDPPSLNEKQRDTIQLLLSGCSIRATATKLKLNERTIYRWKNEPAFRQELNRQRRQIWSESVDRLRHLVTRSLDVMEQHLHDHYDRNRFKAASVVLRTANLRKCVPVEEIPESGDDEEPSPNCQEKPDDYD